jgi:hypothetical protein
VFVVHLENKVFTFKLKFLATTIFFFRLNENFSFKSRVLFIPLRFKGKKSKKKNKFEEEEKLSWDERILKKSQEIQKKAYAKMDELEKPSNTKSENTKEIKRKKKKALSAKSKMALNLIKTLLKRSDKILKSIRVKDFSLNFVITDPDAADCAVKYGYVNAIVYNVIAVVSQKISISLKKIFIECKYNRIDETIARESVYNGSFKIKITFGVMILHFFGILSDIFKTAK